MPTCTDSLDGAIREQKPKASWDAAIRWRTREFDNDEYRRQRAQPRVLANRRKACMTAEAHSVPELMALDEPEESKFRSGSSLERDVCGLPLVALTTAAPTEQVHVKMRYGPHSCRGMLDTGSTITLLDSVRLIPTHFVGYEATLKNEMRVQNVSGHLISLTVRCDDSLSVGPKVAKMQV